MKPTAYPPSKNKLETGVNDLLTLFPEISKELINANPSLTLSSSTKNLQWKCSLCGSKWMSSPKSRTTGLTTSIGCPKCSRTLALESRTSSVLLKDRFPELSTQLVDEKLSKMLRQGSHKQVDWKCERGHIYSLSANQRVFGRGCPYCAFRKLWKGFNDLESVRPDLAGEVVHSKDLDRLANDRTHIEWSHKVDGVEHRWKASVNGRVYFDYGCSICSGKQIQIGVNDFGTFLKESGLDWGSRNTFPPTAITKGSSKKVEVVCNKHKQPNVMFIEAKFFSSGEMHCQDCVSRGSHFRSKAEYAICDHLHKQFPSSLIEENVRRFRKKGIFEIDALVDGQFAIDFNGTYWHQEGIFKPIGYHEKKKAAVKSAGLKYFIIKESEWTLDQNKVLKDLDKWLTSG